jgi:hypothetical protein
LFENVKKPRIGEHFDHAFKKACWQMATDVRGARKVTNREASRRLSGFPLDRLLAEFFKKLKEQSQRTLPADY